MKRRIVVLGGDVPSLKMVVHALEHEHTIAHVVIEDKEPRSVFIRRRARRMGWWTVIGQVLFSLLIVPVLRRRSRTRIAEVHTEYGLDDRDIVGVPVTRVRSVNGDDVRALLRRERPDVVVLHGTRIVSVRILSCIAAPFVNIHAGMTPMYRGVHGGYWALADGHPELFGVTVHMVDPGIDTGSILSQASIVPDTNDNFVVYPELQLGEGLRLLLEVLSRPTLSPVETPVLFSKLWYHPTLWRYIFTYFTKGAK
jgi:folate-dependent phosphoribosylglycinamide formyltransferase PurN